MGSRGNTIFADTVATASAPTAEFIPNNATISATGIISLYDPTPTPCTTTFGFTSGFGAAFSQLSGSFTVGYVDNGASPPSQGTIIAAVNIGVFSKSPVVTWCPATPTAGVISNLYQAYGQATIDYDGSYIFGIYVGAITAPVSDADWTGNTHLITFNFNIFG